MSWEVRTMRSATSCFNPTLYRKTMLRFWPLWALYALLWLFPDPLLLLSRYLYTWRWDSVDRPGSWLQDWARYPRPALRRGDGLLCLRACCAPWRCSAICTPAAPPA